MALSISHLLLISPMVMRPPMAILDGTNLPHMARKSHSTRPIPIGQPSAVPRLLHRAIIKHHHAQQGLCSLQRPSRCSRHHKDRTMLVYLTSAQGRDSSWKDCYFGYCPSLRLKCYHWHCWFDRCSNLLLPGCCWCHCWLCRCYSLRQLDQCCFQYFANPHYLLGCGHSGPSQH